MLDPLGGDVNISLNVWVWLNNCIKRAAFERNLHFFLKSLGKNQPPSSAAAATAAAASATAALAASAASAASAAASASVNNHGSGTTWSERISTV